MVPPHAREMSHPPALGYAVRRVPPHAREMSRRWVISWTTTAGSRRKPGRCSESAAGARFPRTPVDISHMGIATQGRKRETHTLRTAGSDGDIISHANRIGTARDQLQIDAAIPALPAGARHPNLEPCQSPFVPSAACPSLPAPAYHAGAHLHAPHLWASAGYRQVRTEP